jgi:hypothetical protein
MAGAAAEGRQETKEASEEKGPVYGVSGWHVALSGAMGDIERH